MADAFVKNPVLLVGEKDKVVAQMGENDLGVATDVEFYTKQEVDDLVAQSGGTSLPDQTGNAGKFLQTDGTTAGWSPNIVLSSTKTGVGVGVTDSSVGAASCAFGYSSKATGKGATAIGNAANATAKKSVAIGTGNVADADFAIQIGSKDSGISYGYTNSDANTFKVGNANGNFEMMSADGTIPTDRYTTTPTSTGTYVPKLTIAEDGTATREWGTESGGGASLPILLSVLSDHVLNDISWLRADTFSWQSGDVYVAAYNHLVGEIQTKATAYAWTGDNTGNLYFTERETPNVGDSVLDSSSLTVGEVGDGWISIYKGGSAYEYASRDSTQDISIEPIKTDTIGDVEITYYQAEDGHKICAPDQESNISALYEKTGAADYYLLDTTNKQFKLPRKQKRRLIQAVKNTDGSWYNLYSDGWVEQGGVQSATTHGTTVSQVTLPIEMKDTNYTVVGAKDQSDSGSVGLNLPISKTTTSFTWSVAYNSDQNRTLHWQVSGYAAESAYASAGMNLEYYYVGNFEQEATEQTAGLNAELFNEKADRNLLNTTDNVDFIVESQEPSESNGYTWYRKYKSGWVEQGGLFTPKSASTGGGTIATIALPIEMSDDKYWWSANGVGSASAGSYLGVVRNSTTSSTSLVLKGWCIVAQESSWHVVGFAA